MERKRTGYIALARNETVSAEPAAITVNRNGTICNCNKAAETLFGFRHEELVTQHISLLLPQLSDVEWIQDGRPNPHLSFLSRIGRRYKAMKRDGNQFASRLFVVDLGNSEQCGLQLIIRHAEEVEEPWEHVAATGTDR